jgi:glycosyltransferase involved in cell wall biosynthesis
VTRGPFAVEVARSLEPALRRFPDVEFVVVGDRAVFEALATDNKRYLPLMDYADYLAEMGDCAVSLSPVEPRRHLETKSDAKFVEAAARGVVTIGSPIVYGRTIRHGETGLLAAAFGDWAPLLAETLADEAGRRRMAEAAWRYVRDQRMFADQIAQRRAWYAELWDRRAELTAAVAARLPGVAAGL